MKTQNILLTSVAIGCGLLLSTLSFAKTAKDCTAEWRADKAGMQSRGVTEKAYVEQCKGGDSTPTASAPPPKPSAAIPSPASKSSSTASGKTAKDCIAEWRADKVGMQARGVTEKSYVEQCKEGGTVPTAGTTIPKPAAPAAPNQTTSSSSEKTAKDCIAEWRADKAGMQARGVTEKAYVQTCRNGTSAATAPEPKPTIAPAPKQAAPAPQPKPSATTAAPTPPARTPSAANGPTLEPGQFADEASAKFRCPTDTVVWVNLKSKIYHFTGTKSYGTTERGAYMCEREATRENRASKAEKHP